MMIQYLSLATYIFLFYFVPVCSKCLDRHYAYPGSDNKCYLFVQPDHIKVLRTVDDVWGDKATTPPAEVSVIKTHKQAQDACEHFLKTFPPLSVLESSELIDSKQFPYLAQKGMRPTLADPQSPAEVRWLLRAAYSNSYSRTGGTAFIRRFKAIAGNLENKPIKEAEILKDYNPGQAGLLVHDPGQPDREGLVWVNPNDPYKASLPATKKINHLICQYVEPRNCRMEPMPQSLKCQIHEETYACTWYDYSAKKDKGEFGADCDPNYKNRTVACPLHRRDECKQDCQWEEWRRIHACPPGKACKGAKEVWTREVKVDAFYGGKECDEEGEGPDKFEDCKCEPDGDGAVSARIGTGTGILGIASLILPLFRN